MLGVFMGIHVGIEHRTSQRFDHVVEHLPHVLGLRAWSTES
ncbi:MAG: hypothetical protein OEV40_00095 [Acidimicrobiia bacterium]|nr:hypothetical protein [Acidimicrobiia bacterium]